MHHHRHRWGVGTEQTTDHRNSISIGEYRDGAGLNCDRGVHRPVHRRPGQCREKVAGNGILGAQSDTADPHIGHVRGVGRPWVDPGRTWVDLGRTWVDLGRTWVDLGRHRADPGGQGRQWQAGCRARPQRTRQRTPPLVSRPSDQPFTLPSRHAELP